MFFVTELFFLSFAAATSSFVCLSLLTKVLVVFHAHMIILFEASFIRRVGRREEREGEGVE